MRRLSWQRIAVLAAIPLLFAAGCAEEPSSESSSDEITVGVLHSLTGTMSISEVTVKDAELLAIEEINANGGVLGKKLVPKIEDGASDWHTFAEKAQKLISEDHVATVFGGWTSASRKAMLPVFESNKALLWYPVQYEGLESSPYIFYTGATTNQQIVPGLDYLKQAGKKKVFLVGSDYVFPRTANKIIKAYAAANGMTILGEEYTPLGHTEYSTLVGKVQAAKPDAVFNTLNGDSNVAFFKQLHGAGITAAAMPVVSVSVAEEEVRGIGPANVVGQLVAWNYYQTTTGATNDKFVRRSRPSTALTRSPPTRWRPATTPSTCGPRPSRRPAPPRSRRSRPRPRASRSTCPKARSPSTARTSTCSRPPGSGRSSRTV